MHLGARRTAPRARVKDKEKSAQSGDRTLAHAGLPCVVDKVRRQLADARGICGKPGASLEPVTRLARSNSSE
jgi:hypothetical protein